MRRILALLIVLTVSACGRGVPNDARVVVAGDSVMAWNRVEGASVADGLAQLLDEPVGDVSFPYARLTARRGLAATHIAEQVAGLEVDWVILNGGANDLSAACGCVDCDPAVSRLISADGLSGPIPEIVRGLRARGTRVIWANYYTSPRYAGTACTLPFDMLKARVEGMAAALPVSSQPTSGRFCPQPTRGSLTATACTRPRQARPALPACWPTRCAEPRRNRRRIQGTEG